MDYEKQATDFLANTNTTLTIERSADQTAPHWNDGADHDKYDVTLSNNAATYRFNFWQSIYNTEARKALDELNATRSFTYNTSQQIALLKKIHQAIDEVTIKTTPARMRRNYEQYLQQLAPSAYDIIACLNLVYADNFEEWCNEFGYSTDSIGARETYTLCIEQDRQLRRLFTTEQLEQLESIQ